MTTDGYRGAVSLARNFIDSIFSFIFGEQLSAMPPLHRAPMPSSQQLDESHAASAAEALSALLEAHACSICHDLLSAPVTLPCSHIFCSECVRRHLSAKSLCPHPICRKPTTCMHLTPLRGYDVALEPLRRAGQEAEPAKLSEQKRLVFLSRKSCSRAQLVERLRTHDIPTQGGIDVIENRYNDFVIRWNANLDAGVPKSKKSIVSAVLAAERGMGKESRRLTGASSFFMRISSPRDEGDVEVPAEGDDFATLVKKTRARMERKRKLRMAIERDGKRVRLTTTTPNSKEDVGLEGRVANDGDIDNCEVFEPHPSSTLSQPDRMQNNSADASRDGIAPLGPNASIPRKNVTSSQCLSIKDRVCGLDIANEESKTNTGSSFPHPSVEKLQPPTRSIARMPPLGAISSQTTPEKHIAPVIDGEEIIAGSDNKHDTMIVSKNLLPGAEAVVQVSARSTSPPCDPNEKSTTPPPRPSVAVLRRPRPPDSLGAPSPNEGNLNIINPLAPSLQLQCQGDAQQKLGYVSQRDPSFASANVGRSPSRDVPPTRAQLERAERSRLAAIERRRRFYERQALTQMRQPDL